MPVEAAAGEEQFVAGSRLGVTRWVPLCRNPEAVTSIIAHALGLRLACTLWWHMLSSRAFTGAWCEGSIRALGAGCLCQLGALFASTVL